MNDDFRYEVLTDLVSAAADIVVAEATPDAPVAGPEQHTPRGHKSGTLQRKGIGKMLIRSSDSDLASAGVGFTKKGWYGIFAELGSNHEGARPFIVPAFTRKQNDIYEQIGQVVSQTISDWSTGGKLGFYKPRAL